MKDLVAEEVDERRQILFGVRLGGEVKNETSISAHRKPVPKELFHYNLREWKTVD
jgi:hypothetical protein